ncbi:MAG: hypothetical protein ABIQ02_11690, partial [Saprospiraceae bacterium]
MKLITRTSLYFFLISLVVLILAGTGFYIYFSFLLDEEINDQIGIDETHIREYAAKHNALPPLSPIAETIITFDTIQRSLPENFVDTILLSPLQDEYLPYRQTRFIISVKGHNYSVALSKPLFEKDDLLETLIKSLGIFFIFLLLILYLVSRWLSNKLWKPFYQ